MFEIFNQGQVINGSIWDTPTTTQENPMGMRVRIGERVLRYIKVTTAMTAWSAGALGSLLSIAKDEADQLAIAALAFGADTSTAPATEEGGTAGDMQVRVYGITAAVHQFTGGFLHITDGVGEGYTYGVRDNEVITGSTSGLITLYDPVQVALTATSVGVLQQNLFMDIETMSAATFSHDRSQVVVGAAIKPFTTVNTYGWMQTWGPICLKVGSAGIVQGDRIAPAADDNGSISTMVATEEELQSIGVCMQDTSNLVWAPCYLQIMP